MISFMDVSIGDLTRLTGVKTPTIRYYESVGLMPEPSRTMGNQRRYDEAALKRLAFIRHARELGFEVDSIRDLLALAAQPEQPCVRADEIAAAHLADIDRRIARLKSLRKEMARMLDSGAHDHVRECRVIEVLTDHGLCAHDHAPPVEAVKKGKRIRRRSDIFSANVSAQDRHG